MRRFGRGGRVSFFGRAQETGREGRATHHDVIKPPRMSAASAWRFSARESRTAWSRRSCAAASSWVAVLPSCGESNGGLGLGGEGVKRSCGEGAHPPRRVKAHLRKVHLPRGLGDGRRRNGINRAFHLRTEVFFEIGPKTSAVGDRAVEEKWRPPPFAATFRAPARASPDPCGGSGADIPLACCAGVLVSFLVGSGALTTQKPALQFGWPTSLFHL